MEMGCKEMLTKSKIYEAADKSSVEGLVLIRDFTKRPMKNGNFYLEGIAMCEGTYKFKIWPGLLFDQLESVQALDKVCKVHGTINDYNGVRSLIIESLAITDEDTTDYLDKPYDGDGLKSDFDGMLWKHLSPKGVELYKTIVRSESSIFDRFFVEFAASSWHDNCINGLVAHTTHMLHFLEQVLQMYPKIMASMDFEDKQDAIDLLVLATAWHDVGKTVEMHNGIYQPNSAVSHRFFGAELLCRYKELIVDTYSEKWFYDFVSVMLQHHGEFGDPCKTVVAQIVHLIDLMESRFCILSQAMDTAVVEKVSGKTISYDGGFLTV